MSAASRIRLQGIAFTALWGVACALAYANVHVINSSRKAGSYAQLGMATEGRRDGMVLKWNPSAPQLAAAESAEVLIDDGTNHMRIVLAPGQVAAGGLEYTPFTSDVRFRLVAHNRDGAPSSESVRFVASEVSGEADRVTPHSSKTRRSEAKPSPVQSGTVMMRVVSLEGAR